MKNSHDFMAKSIVARAEAAPGWLTESGFFEDLRRSVSNDGCWREYLSSLWTEPAPGSIPEEPTRFSLHLGIFVEPYLQFILDGTKTIESRFSSRKFAPYNRVKEGDVLLLKRSGGPVIGICRVTNVWFYDLEPGSLDEIREQFAGPLCAQDPEFWLQRQHAAFATLMRISRVARIEPIDIAKKDRRGWVVLKQGQAEEDLPLSYSRTGLFSEG